MKIRIWLAVLFLGLVSGCVHQTSCQKDYWDDTKYDVFGRKNCVGDTGRWFDQDNGRDGYFCTSPHCCTPDKVTCKDTCKVY